MLKLSIENKFIESFCNSDKDLYWVCKDYENNPELTDALKILISIRLALGADGQREQTHIKANLFVCPDSTLPDIQLLLKALQANLSYNLKNLTESHLIIKEAKSLISSKTRPEIKAYFEWISLVINLKERDSFKENLKNLLQSLTFQSPRRNHFKLLEILNNVYNGTGEADLNKLLEKAISSEFKRTLKVFLFVNALENGNIEKAQEANKDFQNSKYFFVEDASINASFERYSMLLEFYYKTLQQNADLTTVTLSNKQLEKTEFSAYPTYLLTVKALFEKKPMEALYWSRVEQRHPYAYRNVNFFLLNTIRAELSNKNIQVAEQEISKLQKTNPSFCFLSFFQARLALLKNDSINFEKHLLELREHISQNQAIGRLQLEMNLANELTVIDHLKIGYYLGNLFENNNHAVRTANQPNSSTNKIQEYINTKNQTKIIGESISIKNLIHQLDKAKDVDLTILITGETGTGKELIAEYIHENSKRSQEPFLKLNCAAVSESLLESELFGHEKGSFTGAMNARRGIFEEARKGTVFLDEIGEISPRLQSALLRVLEANEIKPLGSNISKKINCRIITATNANLEEMCKQQKFRQDLFFRLHRLPIKCPSLRERKSDIPILVNHFAEKLSPINTPSFSSDLINTLMSYDWPGNVRELKNEIESMVLMNLNKTTLDRNDLDLQIKNRLNQNTTNENLIFEKIELKSNSNTFNDLPPFTSAIRRIDYIKKLFKQHQKLTRIEIAKATQTSTFTTTRDLKNLSEEGFIEKVTPTLAPRTHYFQIK